MHPIAQDMDRQSPKLNCDSSCKNYMTAFEHRSKACVLSDVYSTTKGSPCAIHSQIGDIPIKQE